MKSFNRPTPYHALWLLAAAWPLYAADVPLSATEAQVPDPVFFEQTEPPKPSENLLQPPAVEQAKPAPALSEADLRGNAALTTELINRALVAQQWDLLAELLAVYPQAEGYDAMLYDYARGAWLRSQQRYPEAVALYRGIVAQQPNLAYPRFDLGVMLFENKQYREAAAELSRAEPDLAAPMQALVQRYQAAIAKQQGWQPNVNLQYEQTDNVNNASAEREILLGGTRFVKNEESLPQSAHGFRYGVGLAREVNVGGNHFVGADAGFDGVHYWDNQDYSEQSLNLSGAYRWRDFHQSAGIVPFVTQNWLGGSRYSRQFGATLEYSRRLNARWQASAAYTHMQRRYAEEAVAQRHNGALNQISATLMWQPASKWLLFGGADYSRDHTRDQSESSARNGGRIGAVYAAPDWGARISLRYVLRDFEADNDFFGYPRRDKEYHAGAALWHNKLAWKGLVPKLNFRYLKIDSNIPAFYSRSSAQWFVSVEKQW
ncbi:surface lipoprotein assembly modifier [Uruburuella testudinis]|uniref:Surface lipoprotein assembly modifier n=1 Tax=Uruburuella testudinis TaxID=1282863 RepID=A0ABY4DTF7_9NEIS|nr:surface lipoprotein assembly modifier [Uruburuella testudinis]UOO82315.1 surface lipoprotein assembly modifier [Uruburuella testudinis]